MLHLIPNQRGRAVYGAATFLSWTGGVWVRIPLETYIFILNFSLPPRSEQVNGAVANEIKHVHSPEVIVVLDSRYYLSYKALYISTCSIALMIYCIYIFSEFKKVYVRIILILLQCIKQTQNVHIAFPLR